MRQFIGFEGVSTLAHLCPLKREAATTLQTLTFSAYRYGLHPALTTAGYRVVNTALMRSQSEGARALAWQRPLEAEGVERADFASGDEIDLLVFAADEWDAAVHQEAEEMNRK